MSREPTIRELQVLRAVCEAGSRKAAAAKLGTTVWNVGRILREMRETCGCSSDAQACFEHHAEMVKVAG